MTDERHAPAAAVSSQELELHGAAFKPEPLNVSPLPSSAEWKLILQQADIVSRSGIVPTNYRTIVGSEGRILQDKRANVVVATLFGRVFGWDLLTSIRNMHVIEGAASLKPEAMLAMIRARGHRVTITREERSVTAHGVRTDTGDEFTAHFSFDDAVRARLCTLDDNGQPYSRSKNGNPLGWETYPVDMCQWRAVAQLARGLFGDVVLGAGYTPEELGALVDIDGEVMVDSAPMPDQEAPPTENTVPQEPQQGQEVPAAPGPAVATPTPAEASQGQPGGQVPQTVEEAVQLYRGHRDARDQARRGPADKRVMARAWDALRDCRPGWTAAEREDEASAELVKVGADPKTATAKQWKQLAEMWEAEREQQIRNGWAVQHAGG